jgi:hypothetical protein
LVDKVADTELDEFILLSFYDKDKDYESPRNASDCHEKSAIPGNLDKPSIEMHHCMSILRMGVLCSFI